MTAEPAYWLTLDLERMPLGTHAVDRDHEKWMRVPGGWCYQAPGLEPEVHTSSTLSKFGPIAIHRPDHPSVAA